MALDGRLLSESARSRLVAQLDSLGLILGSASEESMGRKSENGKWSARENLAHLARYQEVFLKRLELILEENEPRLPRYRAEDDPEWQKWVGRPTREILQVLRDRRTELIARVDRLSSTQLARTGVHSKLGALTISEWIEFFLTHEAHHLYTIFLRVHGA